MTKQCDSACATCDTCDTCVCDAEGMKPTRDNVRSCFKGFKVLKEMMDDEINLLESLHSAYMEKRGEKKRTRQFNAVRRAMNDLLAGLREDRL